MGHALLKNTPQFSDAEVLEMRANYSPYDPVWSINALMRRTGCSRVTIVSALKGVSYKHVAGALTVLGSDSTSV